MRLTAMSTDDFEWWRTSCADAVALAVTVDDNRTYAMADGTERLAGELVSPDLFAMRGIAPLLGRGLVRDDERDGAGRRARRVDVAALFRGRP